MAPADDTSSALDYYDLLAIPVTATEPEIRRAYRKTSRLYHPDKVKSTPETVEKFQLLQVALNTLTDAAEKAKYDKSREAKLRRKAETAALEGRRRKMKEDLERREGNGNGGVATSSGVKRAWSERELDINRIKEENQRRREMMIQERQKRAKEDHEADSPKHEKPTEAAERSVKIRWLKEGEGLDIDSDWLKDECSRFGSVENVLLLRDRKKKIEGRNTKGIFGTALVVFADQTGAKTAVSAGVSGVLETIGWATTMENDPT